jgi:hypothetical protein
MSTSLVLNIDLGNLNPDDQAVRILYDLRVDSSTLTADTNVLYIVEAIRDKRQSRHFNGIKYLVKWEGYPEEDNTWEPLSSLTAAMDLVTQYEDSGIVEAILDKRVVNGKPFYLVRWEGYDENYNCFSWQALSSLTTTKAMNLVTQYEHDQLLHEVKEQQVEENNELSEPEEEKKENKEIKRLKICNKRSGPKENELYNNNNNNSNTTGRVLRSQTKKQKVDYKEVSDTEEEEGEEEEEEELCESDFRLRWNYNPIQLNHDDDDDDENDDADDDEEEEEEEEDEDDDWLNC